MEYQKIGDSLAKSEYKTVILLYIYIYMYT